VAKRNAPPPTPEERQAATETALYAQASAVPRVIKAVVDDCTGLDSVVRTAAQKLFLESWLTAMDRSELQTRMDKLVQLMEEQKQRDPLP
jgi:hypothetical protein